MLQNVPMADHQIEQFKPIEPSKISDDKNLAPSHTDMQTFLFGGTKAGSRAEIQAAEEKMFGNGATINAADLYGTKEQPANNAGDSTKIAQVPTDARIEQWAKTHPLHSSEQVFKTRDDAAKAGFTENRLEARSKADDKEFGFWVYPHREDSGQITGWGYTEPFKSTSSSSTEITKNDWMSHPIPNGEEKFHDVASAHTHPHKRFAFDPRPGFESFSPSDINLQRYTVTERRPMPMYLENAAGEIRRRLPGENLDKIIGHDEHAD